MENLLSFLPFLACPIGMGLMMWMMGRKRQETGAPQPSMASGATAYPGEDDRLARLRAQLGDVQAQQAAIAAQVERLSADAAAASEVGGADSERPSVSPGGRS